ncbi:nucleoside diphosphate kinase regulator [Mesorhizobium sp. SB112]|uniref:nucleoside diphosphate kinase regulator n=1 Tax=Mesorhizobium sp. SB112 TaxID=3151853 RepID=UPI003263BA35
MRENLKERRAHKIVVSTIDHPRLTGIANAALGRLPELAEELLSEMERARIAPAERIPANTVQMGSKVAYKADDGEVKHITLVYPGEADIEQGKVSILTPLGTALIGLSEGQAVTWTARNGKRLSVEIIEVNQNA